jgi:alkanesulfonate monooxygenase SsuD/methylene tetrahydromethanopterin reductase-like flavin-dependent oxidoreductase (luciferase family)
MCPDVLQYLTYFAGKSETLQLGSMVVVLPWHDPLRVAEQVMMLDHLSNGRLVLGLGRGLGRVEFEGFGVDMNESRFPAHKQVNAPCSHDASRNYVPY